MKSLALLSLALPLCVLAIPRGVNPSDAAKYGSPLQCAEGSIPPNKINDDFCDCADGSDEPGTSACERGRFWCANKGYLPRDISSGTVDDGVCDCCDGSDEPSGVCSDVCFQEGAEMRRKLQEELMAHRAGLGVKAQYIAQSESKIKEEQEKAGRIESELATLRESHATLEASKKETEEREAAKKKEMEGEEAAAEAATKTAEERSAAAAAAAAAPQASEDSQALSSRRRADKAAAKQEVEKQPDRNERHAAPMTEEKKPDRNERHAAPMTQEATSTCTSEVSVYEYGDFTGWEGKFPVGEFHFSKYLAKGAKNDEASSVKVPPGCKAIIFEHGDYGGWSAVLPPGEYPLEVLEAAGGKNDDISSMKVVEEGADVSAALPPPPPPPPPPPAPEKPSVSYKDPEAERLRAEFQTSQNKINQLQGELTSAQAHQKFSDQPAFGALQGQCFELRKQQYTYKVCPFNDVKQDHVSLGRWDKWSEDGKAMLFNNGQSCWQGPSRSARINLKCGSTNEVTYIDEPEVCTYVLEMTTPAICSENAIKALEAEIATQGGAPAHDEV